MDWTQCDGGEDQMAATTGRRLWVGDGTCGHYAPLPEGMTVRDALDDYAAGYETDRPGRIRVDWIAYEDGMPGESGTHSFDVD